MFMKELLYFDTSVKFCKFLKHDLENIEILSSAGIFSNDVNWRRCELPRSSFDLQVHTFLDNVNKYVFLPKILFIYHTHIHPIVHN